MMHAYDFSPLRVIEFEESFLWDFIRFKTEWGSRSEVAVKKQLNYLVRYLQSNHIRVKTIVVENEYVDRNYLEDYAEYYARCFPNHPRTCSRLHFFSSKFDEEQFISSISKNRKSFIRDKLETKYIGFIVIRPIPETFLGRACIQPYRALTSLPGYHLITLPQQVCLAGIPLEIKAAAFIEQDKVVSACATSAIWTLLSASSNISTDNQPSPSTITKAATTGNHEGGRIFPNRGLMPIQVERCLKTFNLEPTLLDLDGNTDANYWKEIIYSYISNEIPVLIGGEIFQHDDDLNEYKLLGRHFVCCVGFKLNFSIPILSNQEPALRSKRIDRFYVHDDRLGPYVRLTSTPSIVKDKGISKIGFELAFKGEQPDIFVPDLLIVGLYHKIRLPYENISNTCTALHQLLIQARLHRVETVKYLDQKKRKLTNTLIQDIGNLIECEWGIRLINSNSLKKQIIETKSFYTFNGSVTKSSFLFKNLPKFIWLCRLYVNSTDSIHVDMLFDATEVPQGSIFLGYISYNASSDRACKFLSQILSENEWRHYSLSKNDKAHLQPIIRFFNNSDDSAAYLNTLYGPVGFPIRGTKPSEVDEFNNIRKRQDVKTIHKGSGNTKWNTILSYQKKYIWVINAMGDLVLGEDIVLPGNVQGHPTLTDGQPARIAGELKYDRQNGVWRVNLQSRTYSTHITENSEQSNFYIKNVISNNLQGLNARPALSSRR